MSKRPARVRIIAASANAVFADLLAAELHASGFEIVSGEDARSLADAVVVVWTGAALSSKGLIDAALAPLRDGILVPVSIGRVEPPAPFRGRPAVNLDGWAGARGDPRFAALVEAIRRGGDPATPAHAPGMESTTTSFSPPPAREVGDLFADEENKLRATAPSAPRPPPHRISPAAVVLSLGALGLVGAFAALAAASFWSPMPAPERIGARDGADPAGEGPPTIAHIAPSYAPDTDEGALSPPSALEKTDRDDPNGALEIEAAAENGPPPLRDGPVDAPSVEAKIPPSPSLAAASFNTAVYDGGVFKDCAECPEMAAIPAGAFLMGSPEGEPSRNASEGPQTEVRLRNFAIGTREVTFDEWEACAAAGACGGYTPPNHGWGAGFRPAVSVSWRDAEAYAAWLSRKTGERYRLPTEAEWEYAARAGAVTPFFFGTAVSPEQANFNGRMTYGASRGINRRKTTEVASFAPNGFGLYDMHGNVWEWVSDCWTPDHTGAAADGSARASADCGERTLKGGAWNSGGWRLRAAHRIGKPETAREFDVGLRVARDLD